MSTIAAISTAPANGGIGIIRMSGKKCFEILDEIFIPKQKQNIEDITGYSIKYGYIIDFNTNNPDKTCLIKRIKMPKIGCGLDGLSWDKVSEIVKNIFHDMDIDIIVYYL